MQNSGNRLAGCAVPAKREPGNQFGWYKRIGGSRLLTRASYRNERKKLLPLIGIWQGWEVLVKAMLKKIIFGIVKTVCYTMIVIFAAFQFALMVSKNKDITIL